MRAPDRPWPDINGDNAEYPRSGWDHRPRSDDLAERLTRLAASHPSADVADPDDLSVDDGDSADLDADGGDVESGPGDAADEAPAGGSRQRHSADSSDWTDLGGNNRGPYRPWFSADGASDPWFAEPTDRAAR